MDVKALRRFYALRRTDFVIAVVALFGVILTDVLTGLVIAVVLFVDLYRLPREPPLYCLVGAGARSTAEFGDLLRHPEYETIPGLMVCAWTRRSTF